jgi:hypothetical protein
MDTLTSFFDDDELTIESSHYSKVSSKKQSLTANKYGNKISQSLKGRERQSKLNSQKGSQSKISLKSKREGIIGGNHNTPTKVIIPSSSTSILSSSTSSSVVIDYHSIEFHKRLSLIRKSGVFVWDVMHLQTHRFKRNLTVETPQKHKQVLSLPPSSSPYDIPSVSFDITNRSASLLTTNEILFLIQEANTLFCQDNSNAIQNDDDNDDFFPIVSTNKNLKSYQISTYTQALKILHEYFYGNKLIFCGGYMDAHAMSLLCKW